MLRFEGRSSKINKTYRECHKADDGYIQSICQGLKAEVAKSTKHTENVIKLMMAAYQLCVSLAEAVTKSRRLKGMP